MKIGPHDLLEKGTYVSVGNQFGHVVKAEMVPASNGGMICLHTIKFTHKRKYLFGSKYKVEELKKSQQKTVNSSFINVV